jgi:hypothetical protein
VRVSAAILRPSRRRALALEHGLIGAHPGRPTVGLAERLDVTRAGLQRRVWQVGRLGVLGRARWDAPPSSCTARSRRVADPAVADGVLRAIRHRRRAAADRHGGLHGAPANATDSERRRAFPGAAASSRVAAPRRHHRRGRAARRAHVEGKVDAIDGTTVSFDARTLCVHGDNPHAARIAAAVRTALEAAGVELAAF